MELDENIIHKVC